MFTRKPYTDVSYLACAKLLLAARDAVFPQFATHNAQTVSAVYHLAGQDFRPGDWEFQCLHGMGETLYDQVVGGGKLGSSVPHLRAGGQPRDVAGLSRAPAAGERREQFVRAPIVDDAVPVEALAADPVVEAARHGGAPHPKVVLPAALFGAERVNSAAATWPRRRRATRWKLPLPPAGTLGFCAGDAGDAPARQVCNPADRRDVVGQVHDASPAAVPRAMAVAEAAAAPAGRRCRWPIAPPCWNARRHCSRVRATRWCRWPAREAGKTMDNAIGELREAVDFLRYYAARARADLAGRPHVPLGPVVCISPWNFPFAIFTGQVSAALVAGNTVLAKPAEQTSLIAAEAVRLLHAAGIPRRCAATAARRRRHHRRRVGGGPALPGRAVHRLHRGRARHPAQPGRARRRAAGRRDRRAERHDRGFLGAAGTGGDGRAGLGLRFRRPALFRAARAVPAARDRRPRADHAARCDGRAGGGRPLPASKPISARSSMPRPKRALRAYLARHRVRFAVQPGAACAHGSFVPPSLIEIGSIAELGREVFGPVLHVLTFERDRLGALVEALNATGYGLTLGVHSRIDETIDYVVAHARVGNVYVNRNIDRCRRGRAAVRWRGAVGHRPEGGRAALSASPAARRARCRRCPACATRPIRRPR